MIPNIGPLEFLFALALPALIVIWPAWRICAKAGFSGALGLLIVVPLLNLVLLFYLGFAEWPALRRKNEYPGLDT